MEIKVHMLAFCEAGTIRKVDVPDDKVTLLKNNYPQHSLDNAILDMIFNYGQNHIQPKSCPSVSVGDVIELADKYHEVKDIGFEEIDADTFRELLGMTKEQRATRMIEGMIS